MIKHTKSLITIFLLLFILTPTAGQAEVADPYYDEPGPKAYRYSLSLASFEQIDTFTGGVNHNYEDARIPGNGGLDLVIQRTFSSKRVCNEWSDFSGSTWCSSMGDTSWMGLGWTMHFGRIIDPSGETPIIEMSNGSRHKSYLKPSSSQKITKDYWIYDPATVTVTFDDGSKITYGHVGPSISGQVTRYATKIEDANGIAIDITYKNPSSSDEIIDYIDDTLGRRYTFTTTTYNGQEKLTRIQGPGVDIDYTHELIGSTTHTLMKTVVPPVGNGWTYTYDYNSGSSYNLYDMETVTTPFGGKIEYTEYDIYINSAGVHDFNFYGLKTRKAYDRGGALIGHWNFSYAPADSGDVTTVTETTSGVQNPCNKTFTYKYYGKKSLYSDGNGYVWKLGLPLSTSVSGEETVTYSWNKSSNYISYEEETVVGRTDYDIYMPQMTSKEISRDGTTYTTSYSNYDTYSNPRTISETGDTSRTTTYTYITNSTLINKNIIRKPDVVTVSGGFPGTFTTDYDYYTTSSKYGKLKQVSKYGVVTNYDYYTSGTGNKGNLYKVTDANNKVTTYSWENGGVYKIVTPEYTVNKNINTNGTLDWEDNGRGHKTYYTYDNNLRLTKINPPVGNDTNITYPSNNSYRKDTRGSYYVQYNYDGFGRQTGTSDSKGITTTTAYKSCGQKDYEESSIGDKGYFDYFGRATKIDHQDGNDIHYAYAYSSGDSALKVTVTDEANKLSYLYYKSFGNPDEKYLVKVKNALPNDTTYSYNILGSLTNVTQGSLSRTFSYNTKNFLTSETHPERGTITYDTRDSVGNLKARSDGGVSYAYDGVNRLTDIWHDLESGTDHASFDYTGVSLRSAMDSSTANVDYTYDSGDRLTDIDALISGTTYSTDYTYDSNDNVTRIDYPSGMYINYTYNTKNQVTAVKKNGSNFITGITYYTSGANNGQLKNFTYSNGVATTLSYNNRNMTTSISAASGASLDVGYGYDSRGNTASITGDYTQSFGYDDLNRITSFSGSWGSGSYGYSSTGNRTNKAVAGSSTTYTYSGSNNRLTSTTGGEAATYGYSAQGDLTSLTTGGQSYILGWDGLHRMSSYKQGANTLASFTYDGDGNRLTKTSDGETIVYQYDASGNVISESDDDGNFLVDYIYLYGKLVGKVVKYPDTPSNLTAIMQSTTQVQLNWTDNSNNESGFLVERGTASGGPFTNVTTLGTNEVTYTDMGLTPDATYYYRVSAHNDNGNDGYSNEVQAVMKQYTITSSAGANGSISPFGNITTYNGNDETFTITPDYGYHVLDVLVDSSSVGVPSSYTFNNVVSNHTIAASFEINSYTLSVNKPETGTGLVTSVPAGIDCGEDCSEDHTHGTVVTLTATEDVSSTFTNWSGGGCSGTGECVVTVDAVKEVTAEFTFKTYTLSVDKLGTGTGTVTSDDTPQGIDCGSDCSEVYNHGTSVTLTATPDGLSEFTGWSGEGCSGTGNCIVTVDAAKTVTATIDACSNTVKIVGNPASYSSIQAAYNAASSGATIQSLAVSFSESPTFNRDISITIEGGYNCDYSEVIGSTAIVGDMTVSNGTVTIGGVELVQ